MIIFTVVISKKDNHDNKDKDNNQKLEQMCWQKPFPWQQPVACLSSAKTPGGGSIFQIHLQFPFTSLPLLSLAGIHRGQRFEIDIAQIAY